MDGSSPGERNGRKGKESSRPELVRSKSKEGEESRWLGSYSLLECVDGSTRKVQSEIQVSKKVDVGGREGCESTLETRVSFRLSSQRRQAPSLPLPTR